MKTICKHIPNTITCLNLVSGAVAVSYAFEGLFEMSFLFIVIGAVFDFFDGMSARLLHVSSPIGKELDSLADDITFGLAPASIVYNYLCNASMPHWLLPVSSLLPYIAFVIAAFSALRLAKFNLDERQTTSFIGLPTPANALFWASLIVGGGESLEHSGVGVYIVLALVLLTSWLLVPYFITCGVALGVSLVLSMDNSQKIFFGTLGVSSEWFASNACHSPPTKISICC